MSAAASVGSSKEKRPVPGGAPLGVWLIARILTIVVSFLLYGYAAWSGVGNFLGVQNQSLRLGLDLTLVGWVAPLTLVVLPVVLFAACIVITRRMRVSHTLFTFAVGFALISVITLNIVLALPQTAIYAT